MDNIELLSEDLIEQNQDLAIEVLAASSRLGIKLGWHYLLDIIWILKNIKCPKGSVVLDAGAGNGLLQYILADRGYKIISIDVSNRNIPGFANGIYRIKLMGQPDEIEHSYWKERTISSSSFNANGKNFIQKYSIEEFKDNSEKELPVILYYHCDLENMKELRTDSVDAIVSVSALEHNSPDKVNQCLRELSRVLKPDGNMHISVSAARNGQEFHEPSHSWLLDEKGLVEAYELKTGYQSNFKDYDKIFDSLQNSRYLKKWLASHYYNSGNNGMPWGVWNPQYQPVGVMKTNVK